MRLIQERMPDGVTQLRSEEIYLLTEEEANMPHEQFMEMMANHPQFKGSFCGNCWRKKGRFSNNTYMLYVDP